MTWDKWLKKYGEYFSPPWLVAFDVLQSQGVPPPSVRWTIQREPIEKEVIDRIPIHKRGILPDGYFDKNFYISGKYDEDYSWGYQSRASTYVSLKNAKAALDSARETNRMWIRLKTVPGGRVLANSHGMRMMSKVKVVPIVSIAVTSFQDEGGGGAS